MIQLMVKNNEGGYDFTEHCEKVYDVVKNKINSMYEDLEKNSYPQMDNNQIKLEVSDISHEIFVHVMMPTIYTDEYIQHLLKRVSEEDIDMFKKMELESINSSIISKDMKALYEEFSRLGYTPDQTLSLVELASKEVYIDREVFS